MPFGGTKQSGTGREGVQDSLHFFTEQKTICIKLPNWDVENLGVLSGYISLFLCQYFKLNNIVQKNKWEQLLNKIECWKKRPLKTGFC